MDLHKPQKVHGNSFFCILFRISTENKKGMHTCATSTTHSIPITEIMAIERSAGCRAKMSTPSPTVVVMAESRMDDLYDETFFLPVLYSCSKPSMMKIL